MAYKDKEYKEYFGVHTTGFTGVAFQVCTTDATTYIKFVKFDVGWVTN